ncbi:MAG: Uma2 family endonuclease [Myxococcota bacterium]
MESAEPRRHRFTADQVLAMVEAGILAQDARVELLHGELIEMSPQGPAHRGLTVHLRHLLEQRFGEGYHVQDHSPVAVGQDSLPEPDVAVVRGAIDFTHHPTGAQVVLVVEISATSHREDRAKVELYGAAGIPECWLVDVPRRRLLVYRDPRPELGGYAVCVVAGEGDSVGVAGAEVPVGALLPPALG